MSRSRRIVEWLLKFGVILSLLLILLSALKFWVAFKVVIHIITLVYASALWLMVIHHA